MGLLLLSGEKRETRGKIVVLNVNGASQEFDVQFNELLFEQAINRAKTLWQAMREQNEPNGECGALCGYCQFAAKCASIRADALELPEDIAAKARRLKKPLPARERD
jgi:CRISPR-associated exonuclease Cas4